MNYIGDIAFWITTVLCITAMGVLVASVKLKSKNWLLGFLILTLLSSAGFYVPSLLRRHEVITIETYRKFIEPAGVVFQILRISGWALLLSFIFSLKSVKESAGSTLSESGTVNKKVEPLESNVETVDQKLVGIGGWLILPAIGFVLGSVIGVIGLIAAIVMYSDVARAGYAGIYTLELLMIVGLLGFMVYAGTLFFRKKSNAPRIIITLLVVSVVASSILLVIELRAGAEVFAIETGKQLVRDIIGAAIWVPYFRVSKRVKATFVQ